MSGARVGTCRACGHITDLDHNGKVRPHGGGCAGVGGKPRGRL